ncbi:Hydroxyethylthiazole kinase family-domain-containing protein [Umbelopsis sp. PMI_123]|nr:Hydroxyethylthiazole kinase family-domain-containing protein [Umbelopsis sp. PMI_123]
MTEKSQVDYSLYLVTERSLLPNGHDFLQHLESCLKGGVTMVQLREKNLDTRPFIDLARKTKEITQKYNVPLIINDRVDVALAIDAAGVHVGQDDMTLAQVRNFIGPNKIIGVSVNSVQEAQDAISGGADYLGIGAVWFTSTKKLSKKPLGIEGVQGILQSMGKANVKIVAIGGINMQNTPQLMIKSSINDRHLDGVAVVSAIMSSSEPEQTCQKFVSIVRQYIRKCGSPVTVAQEYTDTMAIVDKIVELVPAIRQKAPLVHHITNNVVINDNANATLALGASPIMATHPEDVKDLAAVNGAMVLNMGTVDETITNAMILAAQENVIYGNPVIFDPVGAVATNLRKKVSARFLEECEFAVIKGNAGEILGLAGKGGKSRGVDSVGTDDEFIAAQAVKELALKHKCVVGMTGVIDYVSDGQRVIALENGHELMASITGSGCMATTVVGCFTAVQSSEILLATIAALTTLNVASELAAQRPDVQGPGTFRSALIDELYKLSKAPETIRNAANIRWVC